MYPGNAVRTPLASVQVTAHDEAVTATAGKAALRRVAGHDREHARNDLRRGRSSRAAQPLTRLDRGAGRDDPRSLRRAGRIRKLGLECLRMLGRVQRPGSSLVP
jgi:hypothetical protein